MAKCSKHIIKFLKIMRYASFRSDCFSLARTVGNS